MYFVLKNWKCGERFITLAHFLIVGISCMAYIKLHTMNPIVWSKFLFVNLNLDFWLELVVYL